MTADPLAIGLATLVVLLLISIAARNGRTFVERQLVSYWSSDDGATLYSTGGRGVKGSKIIYQVRADSPPIETSGYFSVGWGSAALAAIAGSDKVSFAPSGFGTVDLGDQQLATGGYIELAAGRITLTNKSGTSLGSFFRAPSAAAIANAALAGGDSEGLGDL